ncbi:MULTISPECIES: Re/Si-specific NAD(P)(+) transhydrogenase subunit alpha [unclassified Rhodococcus (in: high G+C Gram-positive bacteria)]|uniref:Re/Si-specific NAD(P)(+) transhydrogenase subunit alpha n=1 Tax=unclassified Rhodococcus (in: high G+C Gram-positive bacteria) TaxID=192944 RepID=UPI0006F9EAB9|nr:MULTISPECIES: Re/Si-specific NAD(P)(+) transhydrogenase subunit alpha [unclassified Rhodococcus (in: high G+C Gram-positive bacteria)]KQU28488.1 NAD(P) transhydrogenase subunit alpha [Rhodococcus sp. Leaf225]KQU47631.1 NAD(P) transhydrogenase subunit alpha [Rhodococcus sp. Leaf258]
MTIGVVAESGSGETRVAATPTSVRKLIGLGYEIVVEQGAGTGSSYSDTAYRDAGASICSSDDAWSADVVLKVHAPTSAEIGRLTDSAVLVGLIGPASNAELVDDLAQRSLTVLAMDAVPRISRAQSLDVLSSMANIAGYRSVIEAAHEFGRFFTGQVTAAGKIPPAKVLVAGAGVAGLAAVGAASSLGAIVRATDPRPEVAEQVRSIGGKFLEVDVTQEVSTDGYAKATSEDYNRRAAEIYSEQAAEVDIIITTALIPGRPAPRLITEADIASMKPGSVVVDMAAGHGGNVAGSVAGERVVSDNGVIILGYTDLARRLPTQASQLYGTNVVNLLTLLTPEKDGRLVLDFDDVIQRGVTVVRDGQITWPPPPTAVSAAPTTRTADVVAPQPRSPRPPRNRWAALAVGVLVFFLVLAYAPAPLPQHFTVLVLSIILGYYVIGNVAHALHTPLMAVTNAISGIIVVGAIVQLGVAGDATNAGVIRVLAFVATLLAAINVFGGFAVTRRMLRMFSKG